MSSVRTSGSWFVILLALLALLGLLWVAVANAFDGRLGTAWQALRDGESLRQSAQVVSSRLTLSVDRGNVVAEGIVPAGAEESRLLTKLTELSRGRDLVYRVSANKASTAPWLAGINDTLRTHPPDSNDSLAIAIEGDSVALSGILDSHEARAGWERAASWSDQVQVINHIEIEPQDEWTLRGTRSSADLVLTGMREMSEQSLAQSGLKVRDERHSGRVGNAPLTEAELKHVLALFADAAPAGSVINVDASGHVRAQLQGAGTADAKTLETALSGALEGKQIAVEPLAIEAPSVRRLGASEQLAVNFGYNSAQISAASFSTLDSLVSRLKARPQARLLIEGHTDTSGNPEANLYLSQLRAEAVRDYLVGAGIDATRLRVMGYGDTRPVADNSTVDGRQRNRRIEIREFSS